MHHLPVFSGEAAPPRVSADNVFRDVLSASVPVVEINPVGLQAGDRPLSLPKYLDSISICPRANCIHSNR